ncbi:MAG: circularly permuted type 2 ATP-grasp protein, partial [Beijerinckiaceae bacterium]|nr:circularly permuted type 2 ATP-grasp protein [Beijerinckiaceae bacterium]
MPEPRCFDEMTLMGGAVRPVYSKIAKWLAATPAALLASRRSQAELLFRRIGITFAVYGEG